MVPWESQCPLYAPASGATHPLPGCQLKPWLKPTKCLQMKKELLEVLTAEACQLHRQRREGREEQEGTAMTRKAGGTVEYKISHSALDGSPRNTANVRGGIFYLSWRCFFPSPLAWSFSFDFLLRCDWKSEKPKPKTTAAGNPHVQAHVCVTVSSCGTLSR